MATKYGHRKIILFVLVLENIVALAFVLYLSGGYLKISTIFQNNVGATPAFVLSPFLYTFNTTEVLEEAGNMEESSSPYWWLNSGGVLKIYNGTGSTNVGPLPKFSKWRMLYDNSNPVDTKGGYYPQNIFRLVTRNKWQNFSEEAYFRVINDNLLDSDNRNASNGLLLFLRYQDGNNLYYAGIRVDGTAVIKKKIGGEYFTLDQEKIFDGVYDRESNPNLLPTNTWIGVRGKIITNLDESISIKLFVDKNQDGHWQLVSEAVDKGNQSSGPPILYPGYAGIRTDFMDVEFKDFKITKLVPPGGIEPSTIP